MDQASRPGLALFELYGGSGFFEIGLELVAFLALDAFLDRLRRLVDERLGLLETEARGRAYDLDHLDLLVARCGEHDVDGARLLLGSGAVTGLGLKEAKALVDEAPKPVKEGIERDEADKLKADLEEAGASVEVK